MEVILKTNDLSKRYGKKLVLNKVNMTIERGDIYGFVGENGSGKTTIIRLICGLARPSSGSVQLFGKEDTSPEILEQRKKVGAVVETPSIYLNISAQENLKMQCDILGIKNNARISEVLQTVGLGHLLGDKKHAGDFSLGMRQRLGIAMALLGEPEFIILDEPMNGLDPAGIVDIRELILKLNKQNNITFLVSSHILSELSLVATKYGIISKGKLIKEISATDLERESGKSLYLESDDNERLFAVVKEIYDGHVGREGNGVRVYGDINLNEFLTKVMEKCTLTMVNNSRTGIEDYYLSMMGGGKNA